MKERVCLHLSRVQLPATELSRAIYSGLIKERKGDLDHSALILALDKEDANA